MDMSCAPTMSQELCFWAPFTDGETKAGRLFMHCTADLEIGGA